MSKNKKPTKKQITEELKRASWDYEHLTNQLWDAMLYNTARRLGVEKEEIEEEFGALT